MADSVSHNTRSKGTVALNNVLGAGVGGAAAVPSSGQDDNPGLTQIPMQTLSFHRKQRTERGPSRLDLKALRRLPMFPTRKSMGPGQAQLHRGSERVRYTLPRIVGLVQ